MNQTFRFFTDAATLAVFDPQKLEDRINTVPDWWCSGLDGIPEIQNGSIAIVDLGSDGVYQTRITDGELTTDERDYASEVVSGFGVEVVSNRIFAGPGESLPGGGFGIDDSAIERGFLSEIENGEYDIDVFSIQWFNSPRWWTQDSRPSEDAPSDFVIRLRKRVNAFVLDGTKNKFDFVSDGFLFESETRQIGPRPGMVLSTTVRKGPAGLSLKYCGPCGYKPDLLDYSMVEWQDQIRFRVVSVDHENEKMTGEFLDKLGG